MYREWKKIGFPKEYCIWIWKRQDQEVDQEIDSWMKWGMMEEWSAERSGRKKCITGRNGRGSWERQGITAFCTCQWIDWLIYVVMTAMCVVRASHAGWSEIPAGTFWCTFNSRRSLHMAWIATQVLQVSCVKWHLKLVFT